MDNSHLGKQKHSIEKSGRKQFRYGEIFQPLQNSHKYLPKVERIHCEHFADVIRSTAH